jgi:hypothetical protein
MGFVLSIDLETSFDCVPVYIGEKRIDVFWPFSGLIVEQECMFPYIHHEHWIKSRDIADFV